MPASDISLPGMLFCFILLLIPILVSYYFKLQLIGSTLQSAFRMTIQLALVGFFLTFVFDLNNVILNITWVMVMVIVASHTVLKNAELKLQSLIAPLIISFTITNVGMLLYFNTLIIDLEDVFDARYFIPIGGMVLGNSLRANIVGINDFCDQIQRNENRYLSRLSLGAEKHEALMPYVKKSLRNALKPTLANMATIGIVFLPGMMTGQILGGSSPLVAIEYQIAIMVAIYVTTVMNVVLAILILMYRGFDEYGMFRKSMLKI
ncbi:ABC transporter permease [Methanolobus halotolerans]|uniref:Iron export ABC transporter permease subunit FetB n=1 Tax=Methanolobus halotolerans TaxID=2052935 RepID=A0A4E0PX57_9EURY|nr:iron export ABC transporter permease subunit FetB [Methanolobus halotolerans]TGC10621.1 iron export ABC transporter permease subunit FetB [Methanolobus halotolerans]